MRNGLFYRVKPHYFLLFLLLAAGVALAYQWRQPSLPEQAVYYSEGRDINAFTLTDDEGQAFTPASLHGHWSFLFVGYTHCPDICPTTLADLRTLYPELKGIAANSQVVFISTDPQRDDSPHLKGYTAFFQPEFKAVTGSHDKLFPFVRNLGLVYSMTAHEGEDYPIDHSSSIVLINPAGKLVALFRPELREGKVPQMNMAMLASDFARIVRLADE